ncbi:MAG: bifunctional tRNA (5-methylaminomethyl-2-thiouridine)(34)-methyltransferase MnmD/FAD-dependent 5-carboxymethylaminomethyl-2-thiouridine(34) oxidoreductase MnmC [Candidatus Binataceae bacterium]
MIDRDAKLRESSAAPGECAGRLAAPGVRWDGDGVAASGRFGDVYFSRDGGLAEKRHVFLGGCGLPAAWAGRAQYCVGELGFGTGLNFLATWQAWARNGPPSGVLHYLAVEGYPLGTGELATCARLWPELGPYAAALAQVYPEPQAGFHRLFPTLGPGAQPRIVLTLLMGDVEAMLRGLEARVDAWYLDGFSPERNPAMWTPGVFDAIARLSQSGARVATYTATGAVRRGLADAGFTVARSAGFGRKREMLSGRFAARLRSNDAEPWFAAAAPVTHGHAAIIGGGIAGAAAAQALRRRGFATTIVERHTVLAEEASGNAAAIAMPRLTAGAAVDGDFYALAWPFAQRNWTEAGASAFAQRCGLLQLAVDFAEAARQATIAETGALPSALLRAVTAGEASALAGCDVPYAALHFPHGGVLAPRRYCARAAEGSTVITNTAVADLRTDGDRWRVIGRDGEVVTADVVVLANAGEARAFAPDLPLIARRGQITAAPPTPHSRDLRAVLSYGAGITPLIDGRHYVGATFAPARGDASDVAPRAEDDAKNLAALGRVMPELVEGMDLSALTGRAAVRWSTPDHLAIAGPLPDIEAYRADYEGLHHGRHWVRYPWARYRRGLFALTGLGAYGLVTAPLAAELLACSITGEPQPLPRPLVHALHPARFLVRSLKRR